MNMTSTPLATPKRQRINAASDNVAQRVLRGIEEKSREIKFQSSNVKRLVNKLENRARCALQDPRIDHDDLQDSWDALLLLIESKTTAASKDKAHKTQVWKLRRRFKEQRTHNKKTFALIQPELAAVKIWHSEGETAEPPATPYLDRVARLCARVGLDRKLYIELLSICDGRDKTAHHPPPHFEKHLDQNKMVKWSEVYDACNKRKRNYGKLMRKGKITQDQYALFRKAIDAWYKVYVSGWNADGTPILEEGAATAVKTYLKKRAKQNLPAPTIPDSPYQEGKWDDIF
ncbi:hypothetical protein HZS61_002162 [Fusarium oxysporum f. sp. conglutinans]|uniref:Uncharacterized protein n=2 Tax=Fusarium oxysporum f. sp. conglutinans TaxID=100902 RepID=A0A8H6GGT6_FUSOX|nr:hypothetical protein FOXB_01201 [Fusarium oxysporum f. sp. conglutinans Fo5176]KAF6518084.1 hypothetical protein HZS61_002162 [Fusarium oxysporum f. sp. conglutinans]KAG7000534.1 hypothetical protein FocnCong_v012317 [Fusarium oxysporum f. sp. conglutinans]